MSKTPESPEPATVATLPGVGPRLAERLGRLGIHTLDDLLLHLPLRYQDRTRITPIGALRPGQDAVIEGRVLLTDVIRRRRTMLVCRLGDASGSLTLRFFHFSAAQRQQLVTGARLRCFGEVRGGATTLELIHPRYRLLDDEQPEPVEPYLTPIYPATEGLRQGTLLRLVGAALEQLTDNPPPDPLPDPLRRRLKLPELGQTLLTLHRPPPELAAELAGGRHPAQRRLAFEELLAHQISLRELRHQMRRQPAPILAGGALSERFLRGLPFTLTAPQRRVIDEIDADLAQPRPMLRLVQGDVGSGKTVVAAAAALRALEAGGQAALMAPTELLAEQHYRTLSDWLAPLDITPVWLSSQVKGHSRRETLDALASGRVGLVIGTHALFQAGVEFHDLALVIVDEQHRFGVHQRLALREKGSRGEHRPHQLIMTATPIPRTLAMSAYADLDTSVIDELPPGRTPVTTVVIGANRREQVIARIREACRSGRQAYWVCPLIDESELLQAEAAETTAATLTAALPELRVGLIHGRLRPADKEAVMGAFKAAELDLLVATTVIEVGVDVPNASLMIIENAERLGLAQLHQLRGRVGRGSAASHCVLLYRPPLSELARARLDVLRASSDGFEIARRDLELRGPGEVLGTRQTGALQLRIADLLRDEHLLPEVRRAADELLAEHPDAAAVIVRRWIGAGRAYGDV